MLSKTIAILFLSLACPCDAVSPKADQLKIMRREVLTDDADAATPAMEISGAGQLAQTDKEEDGTAQSGDNTEVTLEESGKIRKLLSQRDKTACAGKDRDSCETASGCSWDGNDCATNCGSFSESNCPSYCVWHKKKQGHYCGESLDWVNLGGEENTNSGGAEDKGNKLIGLRPELTTMQHSTDGATWTACAGQTDCWHGDASSASNRYWDDLEVTLSSGSSYTHASVDVFINCEWNGDIEVKYMDGDLNNGNLAVWYNRIQVITGNSLVGHNTAAHNGWDESRRRGNSKKKKIAFTKNDEFPLLRLEVSKACSSGTSCETSVDIDLFIMDVPVWFDKCMDTKATHGQCLEGFVDGTNPLRSDRSLQHDCVTGNAAQRAAITGCVGWYDCLQPISRDLIKKVIEALDPDSAALLQQNSTSTWTSGTGCSDSTSTEMCSDPSQIDVESFDCLCYDQVVDTTDPANPVVRDIDVIRGLACPKAQSHICCDWKTSNCPAYPGTLLQTDEAETMSRRSEQAALAQGGSLDDSLSGKRTCR